MPRQIYFYLKSNLVCQLSCKRYTYADIKNFLRFSSHKNALKFSQFQYLSKDSLKSYLRYSSKNVRFRRYYFLIVLPTDDFLKQCSWKSIDFFKKKKKKWYSRDILQLSNVYATSYFLEKLANLLKIKEKFFDLLKPKSYLSWLEDIARHAA